MKLTPMIERYVLHWGEMGTRWGVNRSVAQIHALLYLAGRPMTAEEIADTLSLARSNVSTSLRELLGWHIVQLTHNLGDRRDHFEAKRDPWDLLMTIVEERKRREIDPTMAMLRRCVEEAVDDEETPAEVKARITEMLEFIQSLTRWYEDVRKIPRPVLTKLVSLGGKVARFVGR